MNTLKKTTHDSYEPVDKQHYKKRYLVRKIEEAEAEKERRSFQMPETEQLDLFPEREDTE
jgi:hypothetical protein